tara:strand:+ start:34 stop:375 length:342 start_codon:yes stop_codon:yes gene_type:complete
LINKKESKLDGYGDGKFIVSGKIYRSAILVLPNEIKIKKDLKLNSIKKKDLEKIIHRYKLEFLILGYTSTKNNIFKYKNSLVQIMETGAACRTINMLLTEKRSVGALIFPIKN